RLREGVAAEHRHGPAIRTSTCVTPRQRAALDTPGRKAAMPTTPAERPRLVRGRSANQEPRQHEETEVALGALAHPPRPQASPHATGCARPVMAAAHRPAPCARC